MEAETADARLERVLRLLARQGPVNEFYVTPEVEAAARQGNARAARLAASIAALGYGRDADWGDALDWLCVAAERGDQQARAQLRLLTGNSAGEDWRAMVGQVDTKAWTDARPTRLVSQRPRIGMADGFIDAALRRWLVDRAAPLQTAARVYDYGSGRPIEHSVRSNTEATFTLIELDLPILLLRQRIANTMQTPVENLEHTVVFRYQVGQTFAPHPDYLDPASTQLAEEIARSGQRVATFLIYLNEGFEGGETHFTRLGVRLRGNAGDAVFFHNVDETGAPDRMSEHEGAPPTAGEKWLLSQFIRDKPWPKG